MTKLLVQGHLDELVSAKGYPETISEFHWEKNMNVYLNNAVWDIKNGTILKLA